MVAVCTLESYWMDEIVPQNLHLYEAGFLDALQLHSREEL